MAVEEKRKCGFRRVGGLYLAGSYVSVPCCRFPSPIDTCPTCGGGVKFTRSLQWVLAKLLFPRPAMCVSAPMALVPVEYPMKCPISTIETSEEKHALMWVGEADYPTPDDFTIEAGTQGISKRIAQFPKGLVLGKTRVFLAHPKAVPCPQAEHHDRIERGVAEVSNPDEQRMEPCPACNGKGALPGVFATFVPQRLERIVTETMKRIAEQWADLEKTQPDLDREQVISLVLDAVKGPGIDWTTIEGYEWVKDDLLRGITLVAVPDGDLDHAPRAPRKKRALPPAAPARSKRVAEPADDETDDSQATLEEA